VALRPARLRFLSAEAFGDVGSDRLMSRGMPAIGSVRALIGKLDPRSAGVGLASMRERLHQIGGRLEIDSVVGRTVVRALIPIQREAADTATTS